MNSAENVNAYFKTLSGRFLSLAQSGEEISLALSGEHTDFVRWNQSRVRQNTTVQQLNLQLHYQAKSRQIGYEMNATSHLETDLQTLVSLLERARKEVEVLSEDEFVVPMQNLGVSENFFPGKPLPLNEAVAQVAQLTEKVDMAGVLVSGPQYRAHANSKGQSHWFSTETFYFDYSLYTKNLDAENKAVKGIFAGSEWNPSELSKELALNTKKLRLLERKNKILQRGSYRVYMEPAATSDLVGMLGWGGLSFNSFKTGGSALNQLILKEKTLSPLVTISENFNMGLVPPFNSLGELPSEKKFDLITEGQLTNLLVSSRSAKEYKTASNGADPCESPRSLEMAGGKLPMDQAVSALGTGVYLSNLHYLNWSDQKSARVTGMTRFACFWVENGEIIAPIKDMRFDESLYRALGDQLESVTAEQMIDPSTDTYYARGLGGKKVPGLLIKDFTFTL
jgi:predicted Zn-dependent protease